MYIKPTTLCVKTGILKENATYLEEQVFETNPGNFETMALDVFRLQYVNNPIYRAFCDQFKRNPSNVNSCIEIPFLPIQFFKTKEIKTTDFIPEVVFESSGTTGSHTSRHFVKKLSLYIKSFEFHFQQVFGNPSDYCILGLLPSYLERSGSSLVYMVDTLVKNSKNKNSGFFLYDTEKLKNIILFNEEKGIKTILFGVTYALLDFAEAHPMHLHHTIIIETGGMKGRKKELTRDQVHAFLKQQWRLKIVHSEYGMTELLSQAYAVKEGLFSCPPWMKILLRAEDDPFDFTVSRGGINIIDLANLYSCSFIATDDAGIKISNNEFEITGRLDNTDMRGCSLMAL